MLKVYGSPLCPDCTACKAAFDANGIEYDFVDITGSNAEPQRISEAQRRG